MHAGENARDLLGKRPQRVIAELAGISQANLCRILSGRNDLRVSTLVRLAAAMQCGVERLARAIYRARERHLEKERARATVSRLTR